MSNVDVVATIYRAYSEGDMETVLAQLADDVAWEAWEDNAAQRAGVPWLQRRDGRAGAAEFFGAIRALVTHEFRVLSLLDGGREVAATIVVEHEVPSSARRFRDEAIHLWTFGDDGKVVRMRHYVDTAKHIEAAAVDRG